MSTVDKSQMIEMLTSNGTATAVAAANELRAGADFTADEFEKLPGEHFAKIYRRRQDHANAIELDVGGLDEAIEGFARADGVGAMAFIIGADRQYSVFMSSGTTNAVVACLSTPAN